MSQPRTLPEALADASCSGEGYTFVDHRGERRRSYAQMLDAALGVARTLRALGFQRGDVVALVIGDSEQYLTTLFGASLAGVTPASLYPPAIVSDLEAYLEATSRSIGVARARSIVTSPHLARAFEGLRSTYPDFPIISCADLDGKGAVSSIEAGASYRDLVARVSIDDVAFVQFTSGSTSAPKGVVITHRNLWANIDAINGPSGLAVSASDVGVSWLPLYHDMGLVGMALGAMYSSRPMVLLTPEGFVKRPATWLQAISRYRGSVSFAPNFAYDLCVRRVKARDLEGVDLSSWRVAGCGGEPIHAATLMAFAEKFRAAGFRESSFVPSYGLAEHVLAVTLAPCNRALRVEHRAALADTRADDGVPLGDNQTLNVVSCGRPLPGHQVCIVDESGNELPERAIGEIALAGPSVMREYYAADTVTSQAIRGGRLHTGDLGYLSDGELFVCGRIKDTIVLNGRKYHAQDLEWAVEELPGIRRGRVAAFGTSRPESDDRVVLVAESNGSMPEDRLKEAIRKRVVDVCGLHVDDILLVAAGTISRTTSGKVQRSVVKARYESTYLHGEANQTAPKS
jgi:fatty-acyl-CoA synthase